MNICKATNAHPIESNNHHSTTTKFHTRNDSQDSATSIWTTSTRSSSESDIELFFSSNLQDGGLEKRRCSENDAECSDNGIRSYRSSHYNTSHQQEGQDSGSVSPFKHPLRENTNTIVENQEHFMFDMELLNLDSQKASRGNTSRHRRQDSTSSMVRNMKYDGCSYTGEIDDLTQSPHGLGTLRSNDGSTLKAEWTMGSCMFDV